MADLFTVITADHRAILALTDDLLTPGGPPVLAERRRRPTVERLVIAASRHEVAEELYLWPAVRDAVPEGGALAEEGRSQESAAKRLLAAMDRADRDGDGFADLVRTVAGALREHVDFEEREVLPALRGILDREQADGLGALLTAARDRGPTRPHPRTPSVPGVLKTAGRAAAVTDRVRDFLDRRGR